MGLMKCKIHNQVSICNVCEHIKNSINENKPLDKIISLKYEIHPESYIEYMFCKKCTDLYNIPDTGAVITNDALINEDLNDDKADPYEKAQSCLKPVCCKCLNTLYSLF